MIPEKIPFILKGAFEHFLEPMTIIAIRNITVKMECKLNQGGKLKAVKSTNRMGKGMAITPAHTCAVQISKNGMIIAKRESLRETHKKSQMFPENDRDNITASFIEKVNNEHTEELIKELDLDIQNENDNTAIHASYSSMTGILMIALAMFLVIIQRQRKKQNKQKEKIQRKGPNGTSIKIQFVGDAHQKKQEHEDSPPEEIVDMETLTRC